MSAAAIIIMRQKRLVRRFREAGALDREHAVTLEELGEHQSWIFDQLVQHGAFIAAQDGRYFMNEPAALEFLAHKRQRIMLFAVSMVLLFLLLWMLHVIGR